MKIKGDFRIVYQDAVFDTYFNLATEEFLLHSLKTAGRDQNVLFIYRNDKSVVCGKNQSIWAESNLRYCRENGISLAKRLSGGGTVYHDPGNINFSYFTARKSEWVSNFGVFNEPVIDFLKSNGISAKSNERNDILIDGFKISGNAQHILGNQMISHATLLFDANLKNVSQALKHNFDLVESRGIESKRVKVTNIREQGLNKNTDDFLSDFLSFLSNHLKAEVIYGFDDESKRNIEMLAEEKYSQADWIFGKTPKTRIFKKLEIAGSMAEIALRLEKGKAQEVEVKHENDEVIKLVKYFLHDRYPVYEELQRHLERYNDQDNAVLSQLISGLGI